MSTANQYKYIRLEGTREALRVLFVNSEIFAADVIQGIGRELLCAADVAARIDMPLVVSFQGVQGISSAFIGKAVLLNKKAKSVGVKLRFADIPAPVEDVWRRLL